MFAAVTAILMAGAGCERARLGPMMVFLFIWLTVVYCPIAYWTWGGNGWLVSLGALDFAGGGPVHENSGFAALAYSLWLGKDMTQLPRAKFKIQATFGFLHCYGHNLSLVWLVRFQRWVHW